MARLQISLGRTLIAIAMFAHSLGMFRTFAQLERHSHNSFSSLLALSVASSAGVALFALLVRWPARVPAAVLVGILLLDILGQALSDLVGKLAT